MPAEGDKSTVEGDRVMAPDPSSGSVRSDPPEDPFSGNVVGFRYPDDFEEFWRIFPGSTDGKREALKAWKKLSALERATAMADLPLRLTANWAGKETDKIPRASTYLNQKRWEDDLRANRIVSPAAPRLSPKRQELFESIQRDRAREANGTVPGKTGFAQSEHYLDKPANG